MADKSGSPAFKPPYDTVTENQPFIERVPMDQVDWGFRKASTPSMNEKAAPAPRHIPNEN